MPPTIINSNTVTSLNERKETGVFYPMLLRKNIMEQLNAKTKPKQLISITGLVLTSMFTALLCVLAQITIPTQPIPFTLSLFAIYLIGALLPPRYALLSVISYILLGAFGLPVFANMRGGLPALTGVTGGFIMAYPFMALLTSLSYRYAKKWNIVALTVGMIFSLLLCYLFGSLWFSFSTGSGLRKALALCVYPYVLFDLIKITLAVSFSQVIRVSLRKAFRDIKII